MMTIIWEVISVNIKKNKWFHTMAVTTTRYFEVVYNITDYITSAFQKLKEK